MMTESERTIEKMNLSDRELLVRILTKTESIDERLNKGDSVMDGHEKSLALHDRQLSTLQHRVRDLDGNDELPSFNTIQAAVRQLSGVDGRPSFAALQNDHIRQKTLFWAAAALWGGLIGALATLGNWFGLYHSK
jgi:hypothetical protein